MAHLPLCVQFDQLAVGIGDHVVVLAEGVDADLL